LTASGEATATNIDLRLRNGNLHIIGLQREATVRNAMTDDKVVLRFSHPVFPEPAPRDRLTLDGPVPAP